MPTKELRTDAKRSLPYVTISGTFVHRSENGLKDASGLIAIDLDDIDAEAVKKRVAYDRYVYAAFVSCSGRGLCLVFKIDPTKHKLMFDGLQQYLFEHYEQIVDPSGKDVSRPRYISFDPGIIVNYNAAEFKILPKKMFSRPPAALKYDVVFVSHDFDNIIQQIVDGGIDITDTYQKWLHVGFALADKFGESGRGYFHQISAVSGKYTTNGCERQYDKCIGAGKSGITIATLYYLCKDAGIQIVSETVRTITKHASEHKSARSSLESSINTIVKHSGEDAELVRDIVTQVFEKNVKVEESSVIEAGRIWIRERELRRNTISGSLEKGARRLADSDLNSLKLQMLEELPDLSITEIGLLLDSDAVSDYNEIHAWFSANINHNPTGAIDALFSCIKSPTGDGTDYIQRLGKKWLVGAVAGVYGQESHTMLVLCGEIHGTGKSYFFKNLLPAELKHLCAKKDFSMLSSDSFKRDMEISITKNWLIYDDEMGGKSKRDHLVIKAILGTDYTSTRAAYARLEERRKRICFFGGTSNEIDIVPDHGEQRRIIPIEVFGIDKNAKDAILPKDYWMEAYHLYKSGYDYRILDSDIEFLNAHTERFKLINIEDEMLLQYFEHPDKSKYNGQFMTGTQIKNRLDLHMKEKISMTKLSGALKRMGIKQEYKRIDGTVGRYYCIVEKDSSFNTLKPQNTYKPHTRELPF